MHVLMKFLICMFETCECKQENRTRYEPPTATTPSTVTTPPNMQNSIQDAQQAAASQVSQQFPGNGAVVKQDMVPPTQIYANPPQSFIVQQQNGHPVSHADYLAQNQVLVLN